MSNRSVASTVSFRCASTGLALSWKSRLVDSPRLNAASNPRSSLTRPRQAINRETSGALSRNSFSCSVPDFDVAAVLGILLLLVLLFCSGPFHLNLSGTPWIAIPANTDTLSCKQRKGCDEPHDALAGPLLTRPPSVVGGIVPKARIPLARRRPGAR